MDDKIKKRTLAINAKVVSEHTGECWLGDDGKLYNIDRKPIDWKSIIEKSNK